MSSALDDEVLRVDAVEDLGEAVALGVAPGVVRHHRADVDAGGGERGYGPLEERCGGGRTLVGEDFGVGEAAVVVDRGVDVVEADLAFFFSDVDPIWRPWARHPPPSAIRPIFFTPGAILGLAVWWFAALGFGWAAVLTAHWVLFSEPRWLVILHTVVFALMVGYWCVTMTFITQMKKRSPDWFGD